MAVNLVLLKKNGLQKNFSLPSNVTVIGRRSDCDLHIPLITISKRHCQLSFNKGVLTLRDLGSCNGTILNGKAIDEAVIQAGDSLEVGPLTFVFQIDGQPQKISPPSQDKQKPSQPETGKKDSSRDSTAAPTEDLTEPDDFDLLEDDFDEKLGDLESPEDGSDDDLEIFDLPENDN